VRWLLLPLPGVFLLTALSFTVPSPVSPVHINSPRFISTENHVFEEWQQAVDLSTQPPDAKVFTLGAAALNRTEPVPITWTIEPPASPQASLIRDHILVRITSPIPVARWYKADVQLLRRRTRSWHFLAVRVLALAAHLW